MVTKHEGQYHTETHCCSLAKNQMVTKQWMQKQPSALCCSLAKNQMVTKPQMYYNIDYSAKKLVNLVVFLGYSQ